MLHTQDSPSKKSSSFLIRSMCCTSSKTTSASTLKSTHQDTNRRGSGTKKSHSLLLLLYSYQNEHKHSATGLSAFFCCSSFCITFAFAFVVLLAFVELIHAHSCVLEARCCLFVYNRHRVSRVFIVVQILCTLG